MSRSGSAVGSIARYVPCLALVACSPTVKMQAPAEPITINLNINLTAEVRIKLEETAVKDIKANPGLF